jgi:diguanylate cyclase (GGDEF)-like protein
MRTSLLATQANFDNGAVEIPGVFKALQSPLPQPQDRREGPGQEWLLGLANALHTTLDVEKLLELFAHHLAQLVPHDGIELAASTPSLEVVVGHLAEHRCTYEVVIQERKLGTMTFTRSQPFEPEALRLLETALANLVHPLRNALMYREALDAAAKDPLTGLSNRSSLQAILEREVELARRHGNAFAVAMLDIDHFKRINDRYGHLAGDQVLTALARCVRQQARDSDMAFRYGGEEFCLLLSNTATEGACILGERVRAAVQATAGIAIEGEPVQVTLSVGIAQLRSGESGMDLISRADRALYAAKRAGRNRVVAGEA